MLHFIGLGALTFAGTLSMRIDVAVNAMVVVSRIELGNEAGIVCGCTEFIKDEGTKWPQKRLGGIERCRLQGGG